MKVAVWAPSFFVPFFIFNIYGEQHYELVQFALARLFFATPDTRLGKTIFCVYILKPE